MGSRVLDHAGSSGDSGAATRPPARLRRPRARGLLDGLPDGGLNIAHEALDRHATGPAAATAALRCIARDGPVTPEEM